MLQSDKLSSVASSTVHGFFAFLLVFIVYFTIYQGWGWFLVPLGVPAIGYAHVIGIVLLKVALFGNPNKHWDETTTGKTERLKESYSRIFAILGLMAAIHYWAM